MAFTLAVILSSLWDNAEAGRPKIVNTLLPWIGGGLMVVCWAWYLFVRRSGYRPLYARLRSALDALVLADLTLLAVLGAIEAGHGVPTALYSGAAPLLFLAVFALVSAGLRQDPLACLITGAFSIVITGIAMWAIRSHVDAGLLEQLGNLPAGMLWGIRGGAFLFCTVVVALTARRSQELGTLLLLSPGTHDALAGVLPTRGLGEVAMKGKGRPVPVFTIEGLPTRETSAPLH